MSKTFHRRNMNMEWKMVTIIQVRRTSQKMTWVHQSSMATRGRMRRRAWIRKRTAPGRMGPPSTLMDWRRSWSLTRSDRGCRISPYKVSVLPSCNRWSGEGEGPPNRHKGTQRKRSVWYNIIYNIIYNGLKVFRTLNNDPKGL